MIGDAHRESNLTIRQTEMELDMKPISWADRVGTACARLTKSPLFSPLLLTSIIVWEFCILILEASRERFWYDELLTFHVSGLHPFSLLWKALLSGVDGMPPGYYAIVRLARILPGDPHVTLRLPSIFGYILALLGVYWFAKPRVTTVAKFTAVLLIAVSPFRSYALEARSYAMLVGLLAISAVFWQRIDKFRFMTALFVVSLTLAISCHHLAVISLVVYGVAELARPLQYRRIRWTVWVACTLAATPFLFSLPIILHYRSTFGGTFWARSKWYQLALTYDYYLLHNFNITDVQIVFHGLGLAAAVFRMVRNTGSGTFEKESYSVSELVLIAGFLFYPALLVVLAKGSHSGYTDRYGWPGILGLILGAVYLLRPTLRAYGPVVIALAMAFVGQGVQILFTLPEADSTTVNSRWAQLYSICRDEPDVPIVIGDPVTYLEAVQYSPAELRDRLVDVVDDKAAVRLTGTDTPDKTNRLLSEFVAVQVEERGRFETAHEKFILSSGGTFDWFSQYLMEKRYRFTLLGNNRPNAVYIVER